MMSKFAVALISSSIACMLGFLLGAVFTVPGNEVMDDLVNKNKELVVQVEQYNAEIEKLTKDASEKDRLAENKISSLENTIDKLAKKIRQQEIQDKLSDF